MCLPVGEDIQKVSKLLYTTNHLREKNGKHKTLTSEDLTDSRCWEQYVCNFVSLIYRAGCEIIRPLKKIYMFSVPARFLFGGRLLFKKKKKIELFLFLFYFFDFFLIFFWFFFKEKKHEKHC